MGNLKFMDLFAGIGGFHVALHKLGCECVVAVENDKFARTTYRENMEKISPRLFDDEMFLEDVSNLRKSDLPDFDILCAGFPCQPFSSIGAGKGFEDRRSHMIFEIINILKEKKPLAFILENVKQLLYHDGGESFDKLMNLLRNAGYSFNYKLISACEHGLPQYRERVFMVGFLEEKVQDDEDFVFPIGVPLEKTMSDIFGGKCDKKIGYTLRTRISGKFDLSSRNCTHYEVDGERRALSIDQRRQMQGFPDNFTFPVSNTQAIRQLGNAVALPVAEAVGREVVRFLKSNGLTNMDLKPDFGRPTLMISHPDGNKPFLGDRNTTYFIDDKGRLHAQESKVNPSRNDID